MRSEKSVGVTCIDVGLGLRGSASTRIFPHSSDGHLPSGIGKVGKMVKHCSVEPMDETSYSFDYMRPLLPHKIFQQRIDGRSHFDSDAAQSLRYSVSACKF